MLNGNLGGLAFSQDEEGNWGYKPSGADTVIPFKGDPYIVIESAKNNFSFQIPKDGTYLFFTRASSQGGLNQIIRSNNSIIFQQNKIIDNYNVVNDSFTMTYKLKKNNEILITKTLFASDSTVWEGTIYVISA